MEVRFIAMLLLLFAVGATLIVLIHRIHKIDSRAVRLDWIKYAVFAVAVVGTVLLARLDRIWLGALLLGISFYGSFELARHIQITTAGKIAAVVGSTAVIAGLLAHLLFIESALWWPEFTFVFVIVALTDSFSQLWGRLVGKHKLCPILSPGKTWEGFLGGVITAVVGTQLFSFLMPQALSSTLAVAGVLIALSATAGDLLFSAVKRYLKIKDFSALLPGHGGLLDRFDSLIVAAPCFFWLNKLMLR